MPLSVSSTIYDETCGKQHLLRTEFLLNLKSCLLLTDTLLLTEELDVVVYTRRSRG